MLNFYNKLLFYEILISILSMRPLYCCLYILWYLLRWLASPSWLLVIPRVIWPLLEKPASGLRNFICWISSLSLPSSPSSSYSSSSFSSFQIPCIGSNNNVDLAVILWNVIFIFSDIFFPKCLLIIPFILLNWLCCHDLSMFVHARQLLLYYPSHPSRSWALC
jgi:hypothetical protein